jgi:hypothetical protein
MPTSPPKSASWAFPARAIDPVVVKSEKAGYLLDWSPQPKRSRPQQTADSSEF